MAAIKIFDKSLML